MQPRCVGQRADARRAAPRETCMACIPPLTRDAVARRRLAGVGRREDLGFQQTAAAAQPLSCARPRIDSLPDSRLRVHAARQVRGFSKVSDPAADVRALHCMHTLHLHTLPLERQQHSATNDTPCTRDRGAALRIAPARLPLARIPCVIAELNARALPSRACPLPPLRSAYTGRAQGGRQVSGHGPAWQVRVRALHRGVQGQGAQRGREGRGGRACGSWRGGGGQSGACAG